MTTENAKQPLKMPDRKKSFKIKDNTYEVEFPNTDGLWNIEILKAQLAGGQYNEILNAGTIQSNYTRVLIDMTATFNILFPKLKKDMSIKAIGDLHPVDSKELLKVYVKEVQPWMKAWMDFLNSDEEQEEDDKK